MLGLEPEQDSGADRDAHQATCEYAFGWQLVENCGKPAEGCLSPSEDEGYQACRAEPAEEAMGEVVASAAQDRCTAAPARSDDEGGVEDRDADQWRSRENRHPAVRVMGNAHYDCCHHQPDRHAPSIAQEDPRRSRQVVWEEPETCPGNGERQDCHLEVSLSERQDATPPRGDYADRARGAIEVVQEIERIDESDHP